MNTDPRLIDTGSSGTGWSYYKEWIHCPQAWAYRYRNPYKGEENFATIALPLRKGTILGTGLAHHYALILGQDVYEVREAMNIMIDRAKVGGEIAADLRTIVDGYRKLYEYEKWRPIAVERLIKGKIAGHPYSMRIDLEAENEKGAHLIVDHKSSSRLAPTTVTRYTLSGQFVGAYLAGRNIPKFGGVVINGVTSVASDMKFMRLPLPPAPGVRSVKTFAQTIKYVGDQIEKYEGTPYNEYPKALSENACVTQYGVCEHFERCRMGL